VKTPAQNELVAGGFQRWAKGRDAEIRKAAHERLMNENPPQGRFARITLWIRREAQVLRGRNYGRKASRKILW
jgi:hypothetical protein